MATAKDFLKALDERGGVETPDDFWRRQRDAWVADLAALRSEMVRWLRPVIDAGKAATKEREFTVMEPDTGDYVAPGLQIDLVGVDADVLLRPRGLRVVGVVATGGHRVVGARGRVDLECGVAREILLRFTDDGATRWLSFSGVEKAELDEDRFFQLLARVASVPLA